MSQRARLVTRLFQMPGDPNPGTREILRLAAEAHFELLTRAASCCTAQRSTDRSLTSVVRSLLERQPAALRRRFLVDPAFIEALHAASATSPVLGQWHRAVASRSMTDVNPPGLSERAQPLENAILSLRLRADPSWHGRARLWTDFGGRLRFPLTDWSVALYDAGLGPKSVLANEPIAASLTRHELRLALFNQPGQELLVIPRHEFLQMLVGNEENIDVRRLSYGQANVGLRMHFARAIPGWHVRYDPTLMLDFRQHAPLTGGLIATTLAAIRRQSPRIATELDVLLYAIRGCELPTATYGTLQSFSDPALPRNMWINVPYDADDSPCVCPFCFTWFGHELAHTKSYLIETILYLRETWLTDNPAERTEILERYQRAIAHRTLLQIPYTHLYEWTLLMDAIEDRFAGFGLPPSADPVAYGDDLGREIEEAFDLIGRDVELTPCGHYAIARLWELAQGANVRWRGLRPRCVGHVAVAGRSPHQTPNQSKDPACSGDV